MSHIKNYVQGKRSSRDDIPEEVLRRAEVASSKREAQRIIRRYLRDGNLPKVKP